MKKSVSRSTLPPDPVLARLGDLDLRLCRADDSRMESALRALYDALRQPFPGLRWAPDLESAGRDLMRAGMADYRKGGAVRTPGWPFQALNDAVVDAAGTLPFLAGWKRVLHPIRQRCGNEPREFKRKIGSAREKARKAAWTALNAEAWNRRLEKSLKTAAAQVVKETEGVFGAAEQGSAAEDLQDAARNSAIVPMGHLAMAVEDRAEWLVRGGVHVDDGVPILRLLDAVEAGLWCFWPGIQTAVVVRRPKGR